MFEIVANKNMSKSKLLISEEVDEEIKMDIPVVTLGSITQDCEEERVSDLFVDLSTTNIESETRLPLYELLQIYIIGPYEDLTGLIDYVIIFDELEKKIKQTDVNTIVIDSTVESKHIPVIKDVAAVNNVDVRANNSKPILLDKKMFVQYVRAGLMLLDQCLQMVLNLINESPQETKTLFFPQPGREDSLSPVIAEMNSKYIVFFSHLFHLLRRQNTTIQKFQKTESLYKHTTLETVIKQLRFLASFTRSQLGTSQLEENLVEYVDSEYGNHMPESIEAVCIQSYRIKLSQILSVFIGETAIEQTECKAIVTGSASLPPSGLLYAAQKKNVEAYHVPHGITRRYGDLASAETTMFVDGKVGERYLKEMYPTNQLPTLIPVGRPYLQAQYDRKKCGQSTETKEKSVRILLGTQNIDDDVRREFTEVTLAGIQETEQKVSVVIKPHPNESPEFYEDLLQSDEIPDVDVSLSSGDLEEQINRSDLLVTINSNVGLESIILGTPSISINLRKPNYPDYLYASEGPVPSFSTREEVRSFFSSLSGETLHTLQQREESWVMENYTLEQNGAKEIARIIESEAKE